MSTVSFGLSRQVADGWWVVMRTNAPELYTPALRTLLLFIHSGLEKRKRRLFETSIFCPFADRGCCAA